MHRTKAGTPDDSGWYLARSTEGNFEVRVPTPFNDFTMTAKAEDGVEVKTFVVGTNSPAGKYAAVAMRRADGKLRKDPLTITDTFEKSGELKGKQAITFSGMKGVEFRVESRNSSAIFRVLKSSDTVYQLIMECFPPRKLEQMEADARKFHESFKILHNEEK